MKTGDVVRLKSGGPQMTIGIMGPAENVGEDLVEDLAEGECLCQWFGHSIEKPNEYKFHDTGPRP